MWNAESGLKVALLDGKHTGPVTCLQFNPKFMTFASACSNMVRLILTRRCVVCERVACLMLTLFVFLRHSGFPPSMTDESEARKFAVGHWKEDTKALDNQQFDHFTPLFVCKRSFCK